MIPPPTSLSRSTISKIASTERCRLRSSCARSASRSASSRLAAAHWRVFSMRDAGSGSTVSCPGSRPAGSTSWCNRAASVETSEAENHRLAGSRRPASRLPGASCATRRGPTAGRGTLLAAVAGVVVGAAASGGPFQNLAPSGAAHGGLRPRSRRSRSTRSRADRSGIEPRRRSEALSEPVEQLALLLVELLLGDQPAIPHVRQAAERVVQLLGRHAVAPGWGLLLSRAAPRPPPAWRGPRQPRARAPAWHRGALS